MSELNKYHTIKTLKKTSICYEIPSEHIEEKTRLIGEKKH